MYINCSMYWRWVEVAITEKELLLLENRGKQYALLYNGKHYHLINLDDVVDENVWQDLLTAYPCSTRRLHEMNIPVTVINKASLRGYAVSGLHTGDGLFLYIEKSRKSFCFSDEPESSTMDYFFSDVKKHKSPVQQRRAVDSWRKPVQDDKTLYYMKLIRGITIGLNVVSLIAMIFKLMPYKASLLASLLCPTFLLVLAIAEPVYFTLADVESNSTSNNKKSYGLPVGFAIFCPLLVVSLFEMKTSYIAYWHVLLAGAILAVLIIIILCVKLEEVRMFRGSTLIALIMVLALGCFGVVSGVNKLLETDQPQVKSFVVVDKHKHSGKSKSYDLEIVLENGREFDLSVTKKQYDSCAPGDTICVEAHNGGLGLSYLKLVEE